MIIARWQFTSQFGKVEDCVAILRKWEMDVGNRVGWKAAAVRIVTGFIGENDSVVELEAHTENLADFESAWGDIEKSPHHREYMKMLERLIVAGSSRWQFLRTAAVVNE